VWLVSPHPTVDLVDREHGAEAALPIWPSPFPYSNAIAGNAARKILLGEIDSSDLEEIIAHCHWCNTVVGRCCSRKPECWHLAARVLLDQGLRPLGPRGAGS
jgi:hypothetical protein